MLFSLNYNIVLYDKSWFIQYKLRAKYGFHQHIFAVRGLGIIGEGAVLFAATGIASVGFLSQPGQHLDSYGLVAQYIVITYPIHNIHIEKKVVVILLPLANQIRPGDRVMPDPFGWFCRQKNAPYFTIVYHFGPFLTILDHFGQGMNHFWNILNILNRFEMVWCMLDHFGPFWTILDHYGHFKTILDQFRLFCAKKN